MFGDSGAGVAIAAALLGGSVTAATHFSKAGARAAVNTSPEPFSNLGLSFAEDALVVGVEPGSARQQIVCHLHHGQRKAVEDVVEGLGDVLVNRFLEQAQDCLVV